MDIEVEGTVDMGRHEIVFLRKGTRYAELRRDWHENQWRTGSKYATPAGSLTAAWSIAHSLTEKQAAARWKLMCEEHRDRRDAVLISDRWPC